MTRVSEPDRMHACGVLLAELRRGRIGFDQLEQVEQRSRCPSRLRGIWGRLMLKGRCVSECFPP